MAHHHRAPGIGPEKQRGLCHELVKSRLLLSKQELGGLRLKGLSAAGRQRPTHPSQAALSTPNPQPYTVNPTP